VQNATAHPAAAAPPKATWHSFSDLTANSQGPRWFGYLSDDTLEEVLAPGYFNTVSRWAFRPFDRIDISCDLSADEPQHCVVVIDQPFYKAGNGLDVTVRRIR